MHRVQPSLPFVFLTGILAAGLFLASVPVSAQQQNDPDFSLPGTARRARRFSISGTVRDADTHEALDGIKMDLRAISGGTMDTVFSGRNGNFQFNNLKNGSYSIVVQQIGYETFNQQFVVSEAPVYGLQVELRKSSGDAAKGPDGGAQVVSAHELAAPSKARDAMQKGARLLYQKADYKGSLNEFQRAVKAYPGYYEAYAQIGVAYMKMGDARSSEQALRKSIELSQEHYLNAYCLLAMLLSNNKRFADAEPIARKAVDLDQNSWQANSELARSLAGLKQFAEAETFGMAAAEEQPGDAPLRLLLANIHLQLHKYPALLGDLNAYLKIDPAGPEAEHARQARDKLQQALANAAGNGAAEPDAPKP